MAVRRTLDAIEVGENTSDNIFESDNVVANADGSVLERLQDLKEDISTIGGGGGGAANLVEQDDVAFSIAVSTVEANILDFSDNTKRYLLRDLVVKITSDPGVNIVFVKLWKLVNDTLTVVDTFEIDTTCWTTYFSIADMFARDQVASDGMRISIVSDAGAYTANGQYSWGRTL